MFHLEPPAGFTSFNPRGEITVYKRNLPHWRQSGASYFVTFRQKDSLPASKLEELKSIRQEWIERHFPENEPGDSLTSLVQHKKEWEELYQILMTKTERWIDQGLARIFHKKYREVVKSC
ncbi:MAG: hypothetical protein P1V20_30410 [Verrucomicrobiales bacterium]|nr:hypothetical protein [Verrucomicrobiales bacterium]